nr:hypothetical protein [Halogeometricum sp. CBA1124]
MSFDAVSSDVTKEPCDGCGKSVRIGGGIGDFWSFSNESTQGITLELEDGGEFFLCYDCIDRLPEDRAVTTADVEGL